MTSSLVHLFRTKPIVPLALYLRYHPDGWAGTLQYNTTHFTHKSSLPIQYGDHKVIHSTWRSKSHSMWRSLIYAFNMAVVNLCIQHGGGNPIWRLNPLIISICPCSPYSAQASLCGLRRPHLLMVTTTHSRRTSDSLVFPPQQWLPGDWPREHRMGTLHAFVLVNHFNEWWSVRSLNRHPSK